MSPKPALRSPLGGSPGRGRRRGRVVGVEFLGETGGVSGRWSGGWAHGSGHGLGHYGEFLAEAGVLRFEAADPSVPVSEGPFELLPQLALHHLEEHTVRGQRGGRGLAAVFTRRRRGRRLG